MCVCVVVYFLVEFFFCSKNEIKERIDRKEIETESETDCRAIILMFKWIGCFDNAIETTITVKLNQPCFICVSYFKSCCWCNSYMWGRVHWIVTSNREWRYIFFDLFCSSLDVVVVVVAVVVAYWSCKTLVSPHWNSYFLTSSENRQMKQTTQTVKTMVIHTLQGFNWTPF